MLKISNKYSLPEKNYHEIESIKKQIILGNTSNHDMRHYIGWINRYNGNYKKTAAFTIDAAGLIYKHFEPKFQSEYFNNLSQDSKSIVILLENEGWLVKDENKNNFISSLGYIYNEEMVINKKWRDHTYWCKYSKIQIDSTINLVKELCNEFYIPMTAITHNTKIDDIEDYSGVLYKSNLEKHYLDLTPAFNFNYFISKINK